MHIGFPIGHGAVFFFFGGQVEAFCARLGGKLRHIGGMDAAAHKNVHFPAGSLYQIMQERRSFERAVPLPGG